MGRKGRRKSANNDYKAHPLNLLVSIYDHRIRPFLPLECFSISEEELTPLEHILGASLLDHRSAIEFACREFVNTVAFQAHRASTVNLAAYARDLAETSERLVNLLRRPEKVRVRRPGKVRPDYRLVQNVLMANWRATRAGFGLEEVSALADGLETLAIDILRISADHAPQTFRGPHPDLGLNYLMLYLRSIADGATGTELTLPWKDNLGNSTPLQEFALAVLKFAVERGKSGLDSIDLADAVRKDARTALDKYLAERDLVRPLTFSENWFVRSSEKPERRRRKGS